MEGRRRVVAGVENRQLAYADGSDFLDAETVSPGCARAASHRPPGRSAVRTARAARLCPAPPARARTPARPRAPGHRAFSLPHSWLISRCSRIASTVNNRPRQTNLAGLPSSSVHTWIGSPYTLLTRPPALLARPASSRPWQLPGRARPSLLRSGSHPGEGRQHCIRTYTRIYRNPQSARRTARAGARLPHLARLSRERVARPAGLRHYRPCERWSSIIHWSGTSSPRCATPVPRPRHSAGSPTNW